LLPSSTTLLAVVSAFHQQLNELLLLQQEALIEQKFDVARQLFAHFHALMTEHITVENEQLLPVHAELGETRWATSLYYLEHTKILSLLDRADQQLATALTSTLSPRRWLIHVLDYQRTLKNVLEHHEQREEQALLIELSGHLKHRELPLAQHCQEQWLRSFAQRTDAIQQLKQQLDY